MANDKMRFELSHVYSTAPEAKRKREIDEMIMDGDFANGDFIDMHNEGYLKELIRFSSGGKSTVSNNAKGIQFFIVKGGGEGFLDSSFKTRNASHVISQESTTSGQPGTTMIFDDNDLIVAFDKSGNLISSALLKRPLSITNPNIWTEQTANRVYNAWDGRPVSLYRNENYDIKYYGLRIDDKNGDYASGRVRIDLHKQEATNGCIFIVDDNTPAYTDTSNLNAFEPQFIKDIQAVVGKTSASNIGTMRMIDITN